MQRTHFPLIPNTEPELYLSTLQQAFAEVQRHGGAMPFKEFRQWLRDRELWSREESEALMDFVGCEMRPNVVLGDFANRYMQADDMSGQQSLLYEWMRLWNPFLHKFVFDALDSEANGRMHSEHELYRIITSYVYPGEYVTLPNFQNWIRWMAASGTIRYVGIRWGLSETGLAAMPAVRQIDVEDLLEDEDMEAQSETGDDSSMPSISEGSDAASTMEPVPSSNDGGPVTSMAVPTVESASSPIESPPEGTRAPATELPDQQSNKAVEQETESDSPDVPPEAPIPDWPADDSEDSASGAQKTAILVDDGEQNPAERWFGDLCGAGRPSISDFGLKPAQYSSNRSLFLFQVIVLGRLTTDGQNPKNTSNLISFTQKVRFLERYFTASQPLEEKLKDIRYFRERLDLRQAFRRHAFDLMRYKSVVLANAGLCDRLENATNIRTVLNILRDEVYEGDSSVAALWVASQMWANGLWGSFAA